ncbi:MAG: MFS transporter [Candidatus Latescibacteria bacterium]|nr:MFS transporter [Candidatus Latescibacterota bacterium]
MSYVCSCFLLAAGMFLYAASRSFWGFALAEATAAVGATFASGAFQAWLVDRLRHHGYSGSLSRVFAREQQITHSAGIVGALAGAALAEKNIILPWIAGGCIMTIAGILAVTLMKEEYFVRQAFSFTNGLHSMRDTIQISAQYSMRSKVVRFILCLGTIQFFAIQAPNMQWQPFFAQFLPSKTGLGIVFGGIALCLIIGSTLSTWFLQKLRDETTSLVVSQIVIGLGVLLTPTLHLLPIALSAFFLHEVARGVFRPLKDVYLNDNIPSKERATLLSCESISHHIGGMIGLVVSGFVAEYLSIQAAWWLAGGILIGATLLLIRNPRRRSVR